MKTKKLKREEVGIGGRFSATMHAHRDVSTRTILPASNRHNMQQRRRRFERGSLFETVHRARHLISVSICSTKNKRKLKNITSPARRIKKSGYASQVVSDNYQSRIHCKKNLIQPHRNIKKKCGSIKKEPHNTGTKLRCIGNAAVNEKNVKSSLRLRLKRQMHAKKQISDVNSLKHEPEKLPVIAALSLQNTSTDKKIGKEVKKEKSGMVSNTGSVICNSVPATKDAFANGNESKIEICQSKSDDSYIVDHFNMPKDNLPDTNTSGVAEEEYVGKCCYAKKQQGTAKRRTDESIDYRLKNTEEVALVDTSLSPLSEGPIYNIDFDIKEEDPPTISKCFSTKNSSTPIKENSFTPELNHIDNLNDIDKDLILPRTYEFIIIGDGDDSDTNEVTKLCTDENIDERLLMENGLSKPINAKYFEKMVLPSCATKKTHVSFVSSNDITEKLSTPVSIHENSSRVAFKNNKVVGSSNKENISLENDEHRASILLCEKQDMLGETPSLFCCNNIKKGISCHNAGKSTGEGSDGSKMEFITKALDRPFTDIHCFNVGAMTTSDITKSERQQFDNDMINVAPAFVDKLYDSIFNQNINEFKTETFEEQKQTEAVCDLLPYEMPNWKRGIKQEASDGHQIRMFETPSENSVNVAVSQCKLESHSCEIQQTTNNSKPPRNKLAPDVLTHNENTMPYEMPFPAQDCGLNVGRSMSLSESLKASINKNSASDVRMKDIEYISKDISKDKNIGYSEPVATSKKGSNVQEKKNTYIEKVKKNRKIKKNKFDIKDYRFIVDSRKTKVQRKTFHVGDLVLGKFEFFGWWFGKVVDYHVKPKRGCLYVYWFGDHSILEIPSKFLSVYENFSTVFLSQKLEKRKYLNATREFLQEIYKQLGVIDVQYVGDGKKAGRMHVLIQWALAKFPVVEKNELCGQPSIPKQVEKVECNDKKDEQVVAYNRKHGMFASHDDVETSVRSARTSNQELTDQVKSSAVLEEKPDNILEVIHEKGADQAVTMDKLDSAGQILCGESTAQDEILKELNVESYQQNNIKDNNQVLPPTNGKNTKNKMKRLSAVDIEETIIENDHGCNEFKMESNAIFFVDKNERHHLRKKSFSKDVISENYCYEPLRRKCFASAVEHICKAKKPKLEIVKISDDEKLLSSTNIVKLDVSDNHPVVQSDILLANISNKRNNETRSNGHILSINHKTKVEKINATDDFGTPEMRIDSSSVIISNDDDSQRHLGGEDSLTNDSGVIINSLDNSAVISDVSCSSFNADISDLNSSFEESLSSPKRKRSGGITLDYDLLYALASKRQCFLNASEKLTSPKRNHSISDEGKMKRKQRIKSTLNDLASECKEVCTEQSIASVDRRNFSHASWQQQIMESISSEDFKNSISTDESPDRPIQAGDLVIGKLKGFDWWFGKVVSYRKARQAPPSNGFSWVYWYGDHKKSEMQTDRLELLSSFPLRFTAKKMKGLYRKAVEEILNEAAFRCSKDDLPHAGDERLEALVDWALTGFKPMGIQSLYAVTTESEGSHSSDETTYDESRLEKPRHVSLKDRLGQVIQSPMLSDGIKALFDRVYDGTGDIEKLCLACGDTKVAVQHPLFEGGLCKECKDNFIEHAYLYDNDGSQMYCTICSDGEEVILCDKVGCCRSYCPVCIDMFCGVGSAEQISQQESWECYMCSGKNARILRRREDWQEKVKELFQKETDNEDFGPTIFYDPIPKEKRKAIRVLALFDGIGTGFHVLKELDLDVELYIASEIDENAKTVTLVHYGDKIRHVGDVCKISAKHIEEWGPFDLVIGGSPCNDLSIANPIRKGIYEGTGRLFFEFYRILQYAKPHPIESRPFFWLFENVVGMRHIDREVISRFLQCHPVVVSAKDVSAQHRTRYFWGNLPGMNRLLRPLSSDNLLLQDCLEPGCGRVAKVDKVRCITTNGHSLRQTKKSILPVELTKSVTDELEDGLWLTEIERIFGFPEHYTDVCNMGQRQRQKLLGKAWSVPVIRHLFTPLKDYFSTNTTTHEMDPDLNKTV